MIRPGLVSITFRQLTAEEIIETVAAAELAGIEWGSDIHCPAGDESLARALARRTRDVGLEVAAYGSYYRAGSDEGEDFRYVLDSAVALETPTIRVWAGKSVSSAEATSDDRKRIAADLARITTLAGEQNITVATEFHANTLTDTLASTLQLFDEVADPAMQCYWQPPFKSTQLENLTAIDAIADRLANIHVFHWIDDGTDTIDRRPLAEGAGDWQAYFEKFAAIPGDRWALLEFVAGDDPDAFAPDAASLRALLGA
jgi:3-dehydroshikimate dehydratase